VTYVSVQQALPLGLADETRVDVTRYCSGPARRGFGRQS